MSTVSRDGRCPPSYPALAAAVIGWGLTLLTADTAAIIGLAEAGPVEGV